MEGLAGGFIQFGDDHGTNGRVKNMLKRKAGEFADSSNIWKVEVEQSKIRWRSEAVVTRASVQALLDFYANTCPDRSVHINTWCEVGTIGNSSAKAIFAHEDLLHQSNDNITLFICYDESTEPQYRWECDYIDAWSNSSIEK